MDAMKVEIEVDFSGESNKSSNWFRVSGRWLHRHRHGKSLSGMDVVLQGSIAGIDVTTAIRGRADPLVLLAWRIGRQSNLRVGSDLYTSEPPLSA